MSISLLITCTNKEKEGEKWSNVPFNHILSEAFSGNVMNPNGDLIVAQIKPVFLLRELIENLQKLGGIEAERLKKTISILRWRIYRQEHLSDENKDEKFHNFQKWKEMENYGRGAVMFFLNITTGELRLYAHEDNETEKIHSCLFQLF